MVLPIILGAAAGLLARGAAIVLPRLISLGAKVISSPIKSLGLGSAGLVTTGILTSSPQARVFIKEAPSRTFRFGEIIGEKIEEKEPKDLPSISQGLTAAGLAGAVAAGILAATKKKKAKEPTAKVLTPDDIIKAVPIEDTGLIAEEPTLGAVQAPKEPSVAKERPIKIINTFDPEINIRFSKSRRFINQQILVN